MNQRERDELDRHITGNYGEDQFRDEDGKEDDGLSGYCLEEGFT